MVLRGNRGLAKGSRNFPGMPSLHSAENRDVEEAWGVRGIKRGCIKSREFEETAEIAKNVYSAMSFYFLIYYSLRALRLHCVLCG